MFRNLYESIGTQNNKQGTYTPLPNANDLIGVKQFQVNYNTNIEDSIPFNGKYQFDIRNETGVDSNPGHMIQNLFRSEQTVSEQDRLCKTKTLDQLIDAQKNNNSALRCGWLYQKEPTGKFPVPKVSTGAFGTKNGPTKAVNQPNGEWFWDLNAAKNRIHKDLCATMTSCNQLDQQYYKGKCGWCEEGRGIPINQNGRIIFPGDPLSNCNGSVITSSSRCPTSPQTREETETYIDENGQVVSNNNLGPLCDKQCMLQALNAAGCNSNGTIARALYENNNTNDYFASIKNNQSFTAFKRNINNPRFIENIQNGKVDQNVALAEFQQLFSKTPDATTPLELRYAARDLCTNRGEYDKYNFCLEYTDATPNPSLACIQREFLSQGGQYTGRYYPTTTDSVGYKTFTNNGRSTWGEVKDNIRALKNAAAGVNLPQTENFTTMSDEAVTKRNLQNTAIMNFLGGSLLSIRPNNNNKVELYLFKPSQRGNILWSYSLQNSNILNKPRLTGIQPNDILLILGQLKVQQNTQIKPKIKSNKLTSISINNYMWNRIRGIDSPGLFVNSSAISVAKSCSVLNAQQNNYFKILAGYTPDMEIVYQDCNSTQDKELKTLGVEPAKDDESPIIQFGVYERSYSVQVAQSASDYFSTASININQMNNGLRHRFEEYRNPELFICDFKNIQVNNREKFINFSSNDSVVGCVTGIAPNCWKHIGFTFRINDTGVPNRTSPKSILSIGPIKCALTYTDTVKIALYNRNESVINTQPITANVWYRIGITYSGSEMLLSVLNVNSKVESASANRMTTIRMGVNTNDKESLLPNNQFPSLKLGRDQFESFRGDLKYVTFYKELITFENIIKELEDTWSRGWVNMDKERRTASFYQHCSYLGKTVGLSEGQYNQDVVSEMLADNLLSSVKIPGGMNVKLYDLPNFTGQQLNLSMNNRCLVDRGFNDKASSLAVNDFQN
jgi:hypothetical protein